MKKTKFKRILSMIVMVAMLSEGLPVMASAKEIGQDKEIADNSFIDRKMRASHLGQRSIIL